MSACDGNRIVRDVLSDARRTSNWRRLCGLGENEFVSGMWAGQIIVAEVYIGTDRLQTIAARNELRFLSRYTEARA